MPFAPSAPLTTACEVPDAVVHLEDAARVHGDRGSSLVVHGEIDADELLTRGHRRQPGRNIGTMHARDSHEPSVRQADALTDVVRNRIGLLIGIDGRPGRYRHRRYR